ncbi:hypothetical protein A3D78_03010 [Candidatus Gottesmanbacteria bacterium RIFCSPHIGHO2_02_FULL_39_14]|uniref:Uncharacterized protein n=2 Tax=Candidatus Gottesmaniibacteriota TaxID=1752720 RepID=A0A1F5ZU02_9BACT|nr:MAG: hypothetical protein A3D78_03010 [Candidatus Gottesmanbacteria bacterium RIFCSPHIGHO2_02_FULL_39_14]OGG30874.1 MAG: hypothetical protein A3I51_03785 [Candidatus Gottesmanbacteria bacterium RIFCSPLOWO2_02_FULL_38_8]
MQKRIITVLIITAIILLIGIVGYKTYQKNQTLLPEIPTQDSTPTTANEILTDNEPSSYSIDELKQNTRIMTKFYVQPKTPLDTNAIFSDLQKIVKSFPGYRYEQMNFIITSPSYSVDSGYDINIEGNGLINNREDQYSLSFKLFDGKLTQIASNVSRFAIPQNIQQRVENAAKQHMQYQKFKRANPLAEFSIGQWFMPQDEFTSYLEQERPANNFISFSIGTPCKGLGFGCKYDRFSAFYDLEKGDIKRNQCPQELCKSSCSAEFPPEAADYGLSCSSNLICCIQVPQ